MAAKKARKKAVRKAKNVGSRPFKSQAQWRFFFANPRLRRYAKRKAHATGGHHEITDRLGYSPAYRRLPVRKGASIKRLPLKGSKKVKRKS